MFQLDAFDIQADPDTIFLVDIWTVSLEVVVDLGTLDFIALVTTYILKTDSFKCFCQSRIFEQVDFANTLATSRHLECPSTWQL